jgi:hypothetical protein
MLEPPVPLTSGSGLPASLDASDTVALVELLQAWHIPAGREQDVHDIARASLDQIKASSEYDDARALLTIVAFLTALAGAVFNRFSSTYELPRWQQIIRNWNELWSAVTYGMFGAYAVIVAVSAFVIFGAMKPTIYDRSRSGAVRAMSFHERILDTHPHIWGQLFVELTDDRSSGADRLKAQYAKSYILETYLAAHKVAMKLKRAAPAVRWLQLSMLFLAGFIVTYGATLVFLTPAGAR